MEYIDGDGNLFVMDTREVVAMNGRGLSLLGRYAQVHKLDQLPRHLECAGKQHVEAKKPAYN